MRASLEIVGIGSDCGSIERVAIFSDNARFSGKSCHLLRICLFQLKSLRKAQSMNVSVEIVAIRSDYAYFR